MKKHILTAIATSLFASAAVAGNSTVSTKDDLVSALTNASDGDVITLAAGTYVPMFPIEVNAANVTLISADGKAVTIGDNVWIGGNVLVCPGVHIGNNVVIGGGSVVTKDIPDNMLAYGNPCRPVREITEADRDYYFKDRKFDVEDYK